MGILKTKLYRPLPPLDAVERRELNRSLQRAAEVGFTLIAAPAGFGKSTLIGSWLAQCWLPNAWLSLDHGDDDLAVFLEYLITAIQEVYPGACGETLALARSAVNTTPAELTLALVNELDALPGKMILALDDYHVIDNQTIHHLIATIILRPPPALHLIVVSRADPPLPLARLRAQGKMFELRADDLRFRRGELITFLNHVLGYTPDDAMLATLDQYIEGWPVGLRLAALSISRLGDGQDLIAAMAQWRGHVLDFLVNEVLSRIDPALETALVKLSVVDRFCPELYAVLCVGSGPPAAPHLDPQQFMDWLQATNLFLVPLDDEGRWFRFHASFLEMLRRLRLRRYGEEERAEQHSIASVWFARAGLIDEALDHAVLAQDFAAQAMLVEQARHAAINAEDWSRLNRWLNLLPAEYVRRSTALLLCRAWLVQFEFRFAALRGLVDEISMLLQDSASVVSASERTLMEAELAVLRSEICCWSAQGSEAVRHACAALDKVPPTHTFLRGSAYLYYCFGMQMIGRGAEGIARLYDALESEGHVSGTSITRILIAAGGSYWMSTDLSATLQAAQKGLQLAQEQHLMASHSWLCMLLGFVHYQRNDLDAAAASCSELIDHPLGAHPMALGHTYLTMALIQQARSLVADAQQWVNRAYSLAVQTGIAPLLQQVHSVQARLNLVNGETAPAKLWAQMQSTPPLPIMPVFLDMPALTLARVHLHDPTEDSLALAAATLREARRFIEQTHNQLHEIELLALEAILCAATGHLSQGQRQLARAIALAEPGSIVRALLDLGPALATQIHSLAQGRSATAYTKRLAAAFHAATAHAPDNRVPATSGDAVLVESLTVREQEVLELLCQRLSNQEIAQLLFVSPHTVKSHVHRIFEKLQISRRRDVIARARSLGLLHS